AGIGDLIDARDPHATLRVYLYFHDRGDVRVEAAVRGDADAPAVARLLLAPVGFFARDLEHAAQTPAVDRVLGDVRAVVAVVHALRLEIDHLAGPDHVEGVLERAVV